MLPIPENKIVCICPSDPSSKITEWMLFDFCKSKRKSAGPSHSNVEVACLPVPLNVKAVIAVAVDVAIRAGATVGAGVVVATNDAGVLVLFELSEVAPGAGVFAPCDVSGVAPGEVPDEPGVASV